MRCLRGGRLAALAPPTERVENDRHGRWPGRQLKRPAEASIEASTEVSTEVSNEASTEASAEASAAARPSEETMFQMPSSPERDRIRRIALGDAVYRSALRFGERPAVVDGDQRLSYRQLDAASSRFAHFLGREFPQGVQVAMLCANSADMLVAINGIHKAGNVWVPINTMLDRGQLEYILRHSEASCLVVDEEFCRQPATATLLAELGLPRVVTRGAPGAGGPTLAQACAGQPDTLPEREIDGDAPALILYTSGTTGKPKGVVHSHASAHFGATANLCSFGITERDVITGLLPLFHVGQHCVTLAAAIGGASVVVSRGFRPDEVIDDIGRERISFFVGLPMMYGAILASAKAPAADFSSLRACVYAMAPMPRALVGRIAERMCDNILLATGQTEIYPVTMSFRPREHPERDANYWGISTIACETAVMDDAGRLLAPGEVGEIVHRGANVMLGYFKDPEATAAAQQFGWHHTGDLGMFDAGGQLLFLDRKKDMIKTGGENVASIRVETALLGHPAVAAAAVVGLPHPHWGEAVCAFVVARPGMSCTPQELEEHCRKTLAKFEVPKLIRQVDALPMTATGKMQKHVLRRQFERLYAEA